MIKKSHPHTNPTYKLFNKPQTHLEVLLSVLSLHLLGRLLEGHAKCLGGVVVDLRAVEARVDGRHLV